MYMFSILVLSWCKKRSCFRIEAVEQVYYNCLEHRARIDDPDDGQIMQHEGMLATNVQDIKDTGSSILLLFSLCCFR